MALPSYRVMATVYLIALAIVTSGFAFFEYIEDSPPTIADAFPSGVMVVGVDATFPPFAVDNGQAVSGIDIDIGNEIANRLGIDIHFVNMGFDGLYDAVIDGQVDVVISALLVNTARMQDVRYTRHYFDNGLVLVTDAESELDQMQDLPNHSVALEYGSIAQSEVTYWSERIGSFQVLPYELPQYALDAVRLDEADSALVDTTSYLLYQGQHPDWQSETNRVTNAYYAVAVRHDREETWIWINEMLRDMRQDGTLQAIIDDWFNLTD